MIARRREDRPADYDELLRRLEGPFESPAASGGRPLAKLAVAAGLLLAAWGVTRALGGGAATIPPSSRPAVDTEVGRSAQQASSKGTETLEAGLGRGGETERELETAGLDREPQVEAPEQSGSGVDDLPTGDAGQSGPEATRDPVDGEGTGDSALLVDSSDAGAAPQEAREPQLELPDLPALGRGERLALLGGATPLDGWEVQAGGASAWSGLEDGRNGAMVFAFDERCAATRGLAAPPWTLSGQASMVVQGSMDERRVSIVLELGDRFGIELRQSAEGDAVVLAGTKLERRADGSWSEIGELADLRLGAVDRETYKAADGVGFRISWNGETLAVAWGLAQPEPALRELSFTRAELAPMGAPLRLGIDVEAGAVLLREFFIESD
jgi:hypothetical protein